MTLGGDLQGGYFLDKVTSCSLVITVPSNHCRKSLNRYWLRGGGPAYKGDGEHIWSHLYITVLTSVNAFFKLVQWLCPILFQNPSNGWRARSPTSKQSGTRQRMCYTVCQSHPPTPQHAGDNALITNQDTYMLPHSGCKLQQQPHSS